MLDACDGVDAMPAVIHGLDLYKSVINDIEQDTPHWVRIIDPTGM